jgi:hypothetical protein
MADDMSRLTRLFRWCGMALIAGGVFMVVATLLHPSRGDRHDDCCHRVAVTAHVAYTLAWLLVLLGLRGLYAASAAGWDGWDWSAS